MLNLDTGVNLDINPSYHFVFSSNDHPRMSNQEYDNLVSENNTVKANSPNLEIIKQTNHCACIAKIWHAYVGSVE